MARLEKMGIAEFENMMQGVIKKFYYEKENLEPKGEFKPFHILVYSGQFKPARRSVYAWLRIHGYSKLLNYIKVIEEEIIEGGESEIDKLLMEREQELRKEKAND